LIEKKQENMSQLSPK